MTTLEHKQRVLDHLERVQKEAAARGNLVAWSPGDPVAGTYKLRRRVYGPKQRRLGINARELLSKGPYEPVLIWWGPPHDPLTGLEMDRSPRWQALMSGEPVELDEVWPWCSNKPVPVEEYEALMEGRDGAD